MYVMGFRVGFGVSASGPGVQTHGDSAGKTMSLGFATGP